MNSKKYLYTILLTVYSLIVDKLGKRLRLFWIKTIIKDLKKNELRGLISVAQEVLIDLFNLDKM